MFNKVVLAGRIVIALCLASTGAWAQGGEWVVRKSSGEVWVGSSGAQQVALTPTAVLRPGDQIRTGRNGRTLLVRGDDSILISPNTTIGLPKEKSNDRSTTIIQERGSILLDVEKRLEKHFDVETPYLVAVVKGTQFRVSVDGRETKVDVLSGQVEVAELKSGKFALVLPGQTAKVANNAGGLSLSGRGAIDAIKQGTPRAPRVYPDVLQRNVRASGNAVRANGNATQALWIKSALGEVNLDFQKVTKGLVSNSTASLSNNGHNERENGLDSGGGNGLGDGNGKGKGLAYAYGIGGGNGLIGARGTRGCNGNGRGKGSSC